MWKKHTRTVDAVDELGRRTWNRRNHGRSVQSAKKGTSPLHRMMGAAAFSGVPEPPRFRPRSQGRIKILPRHVGRPQLRRRGLWAALPHRTRKRELPRQLSHVNHQSCGDRQNQTRKPWRSLTLARPRIRPKHEAGLMLKNLLRDGRKLATERAALLKADRYDLDKLSAGRIRRKAGADSKKFTGDKFYSWFLPLPA